ncbi:calcium-binding protein [Streptomyces sp. NPDC014776]|uniref:calcium-binding protein n=1 Tax=Streptomyces sp. NPDC014776 TaxID=3364909 RepID=UPI0036FE076E
MLTPLARPAGRRTGERRRRSLLARAGTVAATVLALVLTLPGTAAAAPGDPDPSFDGDGRVLTDFGGYDYGNDLAVQPDGRIVTVGAGTSAAGDADFALTRHTPDGSPDPSFGGDGKVTTPVAPEGLDDWANAVTLQSDGKIVVAGTAWRDAENCCWFVVARYNGDGSLDPTFNGDGVAYADLAGPTEALDVAIDSGNRIVAAGYSGGTLAVARFNPDGSPDTGFGGTGVVTADPAPGSLEEGGDGRALALQPDGKIVVGGEVGTTRFDFVLMRFNGNGSVDTGFGSGGIARTDFGGYEAVESLAVQPDGRIVAAGSSDSRYALARYTTDGSLDPSFDGDGRVTTPGGNASDLALQSDGRIVVAGGTTGGDFGVLRYNPDGALDGGFGNGGQVTTDFGGGDTARGVKLDSSGRVVAAGQGGPGSDLALARHQGGGATPPPPPAGADLAVTKTGPAALTLGDRATYTVRVTNAAGSTTTATGVTLTDTLSGAGGTLVSATASQGGCTLTATTATCALNSLAPGASATVTVVAEPRTSGTLTDTAHVTAGQTDPAPGNDTATAATGVTNSRGCTIVGTSGADTLTGTAGNDVICGLGGNDTIRSGSGTDTVHGDYGNDVIDGGTGNDTLYGGPGNDNVYGNYGADRVTTTDGVTANDTANGGPDPDTCTTDPGDTRISCP